MKENQKPIHKVTVELLDVGLRMCNIQVNTTTLNRLIDVFELIQERGGGTRISDIEELKMKWKNA